MRRAQELEEFQPDEEEWPAEAPAAPGLTVTYDLLTSQAHPRIYIVLVPTDDPTTIPAHLRWGGCNACPRPEYHIAALCHWRDRYGAELVGLDMATLNVRVARRPATPEQGSSWRGCNTSIATTSSTGAWTPSAHWPPR